MLLITFRSVAEYLTKIIGLTIQKIAKGGMTMKKIFRTLWGCSKLGMSQPRWKVESKSELYFRDSAEAQRLHPDQQRLAIICEVLFICRIISLPPQSIWRIYRNLPWSLCPSDQSPIKNAFFISIRLPIRWRIVLLAVYDSHTERIRNDNSPLATCLCLVGE